jgi:hypothetical protein
MTAIRREKQLKGWRREKKIILIEKMNPRWQDLAENWAGKCDSGDNPSRERLESAWQGTHSRGPSTCAYPASRDSRGAQDDKI